MRRAAQLVLAAALLAARAEAATVYAANDGVDGVACGTKEAPCRSIGMAVAQAAAGDAVEVGPGRYGDLDADGALGSVPGEETFDAECSCLVDVDERIALRSRDGAASTVIAAAGLGGGDAAVALNAEGSAIGQVGRGLTILAAGARGIETTAADVAIAGNVVVGASVGIEVNGPGTSIADNRVAKSTGGIHVFADSCLVSRNAAVGNAESGFHVEGTGTVLDGNAMIGNGLGISVDGTQITVRGSTIAGNRLVGASFVGSGHTVQQSSLYGNGDAESGNPNCGLSSDTVLVATGNYWGSALGPGHDPADLVCSEDAQFEPFAKKDRALKLKPVY